MPLQVSNKRLIATEQFKLLEIESNTTHGFCDILVSNSSGVDAHATAHISASATPNVNDIVIPNTVIPPHSSISVSCMPIKAGESVWGVTDAGEITMRVTILGSVATN